MSKIDTGGPAFPLVTWKSPDGMCVELSHNGMTLRDYFAGQAMQVLIGQIDGGDVETAKDIAELIKTASKLSYVVAGAMIVARKGGEA
ncbi:MAG: hypothetical protein DI589_11205 [Shinella sp.]|nr:MAG: hypothetical protein DI589_11205 [Shinella sp.]